MEKIRKDVCQFHSDRKKLGLDKNIIDRKGNKYDFGG